MASFPGDEKATEQKKPTPSSDSKTTYSVTNHGQKWWWRAVGYVPNGQPHESESDLLGVLGDGNLIKRRNGNGVEKETLVIFN